MPLVSALCSCRPHCAWLMAEVAELMRRHHPHPLVQCVHPLAGLVMPLHLVTCPHLAIHLVIHLLLTVHRIRLPSHVHAYHSELHTHHICSFNCYTLCQAYTITLGLCVISLPYSEQTSPVHPKVSEHRPNSLPQCGPVLKLLWADLLNVAAGHRLTDDTVKPCLSQELISRAYAPKVQKLINLENHQVVSHYTWPGVFCTSPSPHRPTWQCTVYINTQQAISPLTSQKSKHGNAHTCIIQY